MQRLQPGTSKAYSQGFTSIELLVYLLLFSVLCATASNALHQLLQRRKVRLTSLEVQSALLVTQRLALTEDKRCELDFTTQEVNPTGCTTRLPGHQLSKPLIVSARFSAVSVGGGAASTFVAHPSQAVSPGAVQLESATQRCTIHTSLRGALRESC